MALDHLSTQQRAKEWAWKLRTGKIVVSYEDRMEVVRLLDECAAMPQQAQLPREVADLIRAAKRAAPRGPIEGHHGHGPGCDDCEALRRAIEAAEAWLAKQEAKS